jgi:hypothetical protein
MIVDGWASVAEFTVYLQPYEVAGWGNPLAEFIVTLQPMEAAGWGNPLAEFIVTLQPMEAAGWGNPLAEFIVTLQPPTVACSTDADCPEGYVCSGGVCVPLEGEFPWGYVALGAAAVGIILLATSRKEKSK